ncbi:MAG: NADH:flavin oxidoreductase [Polyangiales bacterium]
MSATHTHSVFSSATIGNTTLRNRVIKAATLEGMSHQCRPTTALLNYHVALAKGGVGMTTLGFCAVSKNARMRNEQIYLRDDVVAPLRQICDAVHNEGSGICIQLGHCGYITSNRQLAANEHLGPSRRFNLYGALNGHPYASAMSSSDVSDRIDEFANAARLAMDAGFDAIELLFGHGYLVHQFLTAASNRRTDEYGGSIENRARLGVKIIERIRDSLGPYFPLLIKMNLSDGVRGGLEVDEAAQFAKIFENAGASALVLSGGLADRSPLYTIRGEAPLDDLTNAEHNVAQKIALATLGRTLVKPVPFEPMYFLTEAIEIRKAVRLPLVLVGGITSMSDLEQTMRHGFEFAAMGRALIHDPYLIAKFMVSELNRSGCEPCNRCLAEAELEGGLRCAKQPLQLMRRERVVAEAQHLNVL